MFRKFLVRLKQITDSMTDCQHDSEKDRKLPSCVYDYDIINGSWFLIANMNGYLAVSFYRFQHA